MGIEDLPEFIIENYQVHERNHSIAILKNDFPQEYNDILELLINFELTKTEILTPGGRKSPIATNLDSVLYDKGWVEKTFHSQIVIDGQTANNPTHGIDCYKNRIALEIEWNNKDPFYDRDLNNFRVLFDMKAISVGVIVTRSSELQVIFENLGKGKSYGNSTTHWNKLVPRIEGGGGGGCPILAFGISGKLYKKDK